MKPVWRAFALFAVVLGPSAARADMGAPGFKSRELHVVIDNLGDFPNHVFFLVPVQWVMATESEGGPGRPNQPERMVPGELYLPGYPARFIHKWVLVALPRSQVEGAGPVTWEMLTPDAPRVRYSNRLELTQPGLVSILSPPDYEVRHFRLALTDREFVLTPGAVEQGSNGFGSWVPSLMLTLAIIGTGLLVVRGLRRWLVRSPDSGETKKRKLAGVGGPVRVGDRGVTESPLCLTGVARVGGERRAARSDRGPIELGTEVVVVGDDPLGLVVRPVEPGRAGEKLPDHGRIVYATPQERADAIERRDQIAEQRDWAAERRGGGLESAMFGAGAAGVTLGALWNGVDDLAPPAVLIGAALVSGALWGFVVYRFVYWVLGAFRSGYRRVATLSTRLGLVGSAVGGVFGVWTSGAWSGVALGVFLTVALAAAVPAILIVSMGNAPDA